MPKLDWIAVQDAFDKKKDIGAVGFVGNDIVTIVSFYDAADANRDGEVSWGEWLVSKNPIISTDGINITEVCQAAKYDMRILQRDASIIDMANKQFMEFATGLVMDGVYAVYFFLVVLSVIWLAVTLSQIARVLDEKGDEVHAQLLSQDAAEERPKIERTRSFTISPPRVTIVSRTTSSSTVPTRASTWPLVSACTVAWAIAWPSCSSRSYGRNCSRASTTSRSSASRKSCSPTSCAATPR